MISRIFIGIIRLYQLFISPLFPPSCRFYPTCSEYGIAAFRKYPFYKAFWKTAWRILRCNPWNRGGYDPVE